jgi:hypothetical protein
VKLWVGDRSTAASNKTIDLDALLDTGSGTIDGATALKLDAKRQQRLFEQ